MSRLIVKNLPNGIQEERLKLLFGKHGQLTDCKLKYTHKGVFRKFAFIGYKSADAAATAIKQCNNTYIDTSQIQVDVARNFGDGEKPRAWSKYSAESSAFQKTVKQNAQLSTETETIKKKADGKKMKAKDKVDEFLGELKDDTGFQEFLDIHQNVGTKPVWTNDASIKVDSQPVPAVITPKVKGTPDREPETDETDDSSDKDAEINKDGVKYKEMSSKVAAKKGVSDVEYLKSKMSSSALASSDSESESGSTSDDGDDSDNSGGSDDEDEAKTESKQSEEKNLDSGKSSNKQTDSTNLIKYTLKMSGLDGRSGEKALTEFFRPCKPTSIRIPRNARKRPIGIAYIDFRTEKELTQAMKKNKSIIKGQRVFLKRALGLVEGEKAKEETETEKLRPWEAKVSDKDDKGDEEIAETGRLFIRNLAYTCQQEDLEEHFGKYGPMTVHLSVDHQTKKIKGFAFVTFMMPEHAVTAYTELDGTVFLGRMLHILPAKPMRAEKADDNENASFKKKKQQKQKAMSGSSHNWNSLFLGSSAVADVMAEKYATLKSDILNPEGGGSLGVRLALGETQVVSEMRDFLLENSVCLDSFSQAAAPRSKSVILVKNLPMNTKAEDLRDVFSKHGTVGRVVLPPSGITAIVEYLEQTEAKAGFTRLAYSKFQHTPLYLEWAPMGVFTAPGLVKPTESEMKVDADKEASEATNELMDSSDNEEPAEPDTVIFVKNLNFSTAEEDLKKTFEKCGKLKNVTIAQKKDMKNPGQMLSMGYGFVEFWKRVGAQDAMKQLQHAILDDHRLELKVSNRTTEQTKVRERKAQKNQKQRSTKILVRNIPFEATRQEVFELFKVFGELKTVRLPKKLSGTGTHRGFAFVDFLTKQDAKRAFKALCHSTHLYGRRLVLEWAETEENIDDLRKKTADHFHEEVPSKKLKKASLKDDLDASHDD